MQWKRFKVTHVVKLLIPMSISGTNCKDHEPCSKYPRGLLKLAMCLASAYIPSQRDGTTVQTVFISSHAQHNQGRFMLPIPRP